MFLKCEEKRKKSLRGSPKVSGLRPMAIKKHTVLPLRHKAQLIKRRRLRLNCRSATRRLIYGLRPIKTKNRRIFRGRELPIRCRRLRLNCHFVARHRIYGLVPNGILRFGFMHCLSDGAAFGSPIASRFPVGYPGCAL